MIRGSTSSTLFPYTTLFRSGTPSPNTSASWSGSSVCLRTYRSEEHTSELQSRRDLVCRLLLEKKNTSTHGMSDKAGIRMLARDECGTQARGQCRERLRPFFFLMLRPPPRSTLFPYTTLFR